MLVEETEIKDQNIHSSFYSYFAVLLVVTVLSDQFVLILNSTFPNSISRMSEVFDNYTFPILFIFFMLLVSRLITIFIAEININTPIPIWKVSVATLILVHPVIIFLNKSSIDIAFLWKINLSDEYLVTLLFSSAMYIIAAYGVMQILLRSVKKSDTQLAAILKSVHEDVLVFFTIIFIFLYIYQDIIRFGFESLELSMPWKIILYTSFLFMVGPEVNSSKKRKDRKSHE